MKYRTIVVDPPWQTMGGPLRVGVGKGWQFRPGMGNSQPLPYATLSVRQLQALPVGQLAETDAALYLWTINAYVEQAYGLARSWGFKPSTLHTWCKEAMGGGLGGTFGITTEFFLYARRGSPTEKRSTGTWHRWKRHYENGHPSHSSKPDHFYDLVEQVSPGSYVELFSRRHRLGWDVWGDESANTAGLEVGV